MNKLYKVIEKSQYCDENIYGYIEEEYVDGSVKFLKLDSDMEVFLSKESLQEVKGYE